MFEKKLVAALKPADRLKRRLVTGSPETKTSASARGPHRGMVSRVLKLGDSTWLVFMLLDPDGKEFHLSWGNSLNEGPILMHTGLKDPL